MQSPFPVLPLYLHLLSQIAARAYELLEIWGSEFEVLQVITNNECGALSFMGLTETLEASFRKILDKYQTEVHPGKIQPFLSFGLRQRWEPGEQRSFFSVP